MKLSKNECLNNIFHIIATLHDLLLNTCFIYFGDTSTRSSPLILNIFHLSIANFFTSGVQLAKTITIFGLHIFISLLLNFAATNLPS